MSSHRSISLQGVCRLSGASLKKGTATQVLPTQNVGIVSAIPAGMVCLSSKTRSFAHSAAVSPRTVQMTGAEGASATIKRLSQIALMPGANVHMGRPVRPTSRVTTIVSAVFAMRHPPNVQAATLLDSHSLRRSISLKRGGL